MMKTRKNPYTNEELFRTIVDTLKQENKYPTILDYHCPDNHKTEEITSYEWDVKGDLEFGSSEGIYLSVFAYGNFNSQRKSIPLGTFKTLCESDEAMYTMARLEADCILIARKFLGDNIDDFTWEGFTIEFASKKRLPVFECKTFERAMERVTTFDAPFEYAVITDNSTGKITKIDKEGKKIE